MSVVYNEAFNVKESLKRIPKYNFGNFPTRIIKNQYLSDELGINVYIKMESEADFFGTGNKVRKLQYLLKEAQITDCKTIVADGIIQSNCCYAVTTYAKLLGFHTRILYIGDESNVGNYLKTRLMGAQVDIISEWSPENVNNGINKIVKDEAMKSRKVYHIPTGGTSATGVLGSLELALEIEEQEIENDIEFDHIVHPTGTGGTQLGMVLGKAFLNKKWNLNPIAVANDQETFDEICKKYTEELINKYEFPKETLNITQDVYTEALGNGYMSFEFEDIVDMVKIYRKTGIYFDSIYNYKTLKGLRLLVQKGKIKSGDNVLLIHTGGTNESYGQDGKLQLTLQKVITQLKGQ